MTNFILLNLNNSPFKDGDLIKYNMESKSIMYNELPGLNGNEFTIKLEANHFKSGEIIVPTKTDVLIEVIKVYPRTWWRNLRTRLGLRTKMFECKIVRKPNSL